jgi:hypothetical protein
MPDARPTGNHGILKAHRLRLAYLEAGGTLENAQAMAADLEGSVEHVLAADVNPACRLTVYHRAPVASSPTTTPAEHERSSGSIRTRPKQMICTNE